MKQKQAASTVERRLLEIPSATNRKTVQSYFDEIGLRRKPQTLVSKLDPIVALGKRLGKRNWKAASRSDVIAAIASHRFHKGAHRSTKNLPVDQALSPATQYLWRIHLQSFYKWLLETDGLPAQFKQMPFLKKDAICKQLTELALSPEEVGQILAGAESLRDRCIIMTLIEGGFRSSEAAALRLDHIEKRDGGYWLTLPQDEPLLKTGPREVAVPIIAFRADFEAWLTTHPRRHDARAPLFVTESNRNQGARMTGPTIGDVVVRCARRAGMRHVHAHMLRHTSATLKLAKGMPTEAVRLTHGWTPQSTMLGYYSHVTPHYESMMLEAHGVQSKKRKLLDIVGSISCQVCGTANPVSSPKCKKCGVLTSEAAQESAHRTRIAHILDYAAPKAIQGLANRLLLAVARARGFTEASA